MLSLVLLGCKQEVPCVSGPKRGAVKKPTKKRVVACSETVVKFGQHERLHSKLWYMRDVSLCPSILLPLRVVFCKTYTSMKGGSVLPSLVPGSALLLLSLYCQEQIESKDMVSQDMVRQINKLSLLFQKAVSLCKLSSLLSPLICSPTAHPVHAEETLLI